MLKTSRLLPGAAGTSTERATTGEGRDRGKQSQTGGKIRQTSLFRTESERVGGEEVKAE